MNTLIDRLLSLRVADVMARNVVTVPERMPLSEVACVMSKGDVSSAIVVDDQGRALGVISAWDFVRLHCEQGCRGGNVEQRLTLPMFDDGRCLSVLEDCACHYMSTALQTIDVGASLLRAARIMNLEHLHHLFVLDEQHRPLGVVTTMDITAAVANAFEEINAAASRATR